MRNIILFMLLLFINCNSQRKIADKKYMDVETTFQKYRDIRARYDSSVEKNKQNLIYENGGYFNKYLYDKEAKEKRYTHEKSDSKFIMEEGGKAYFVKDDGQTFYIYTLENEKIIEQSRIIKKDDKVDIIINSVEGIGVRYDYYNNKIYITHFIEDEIDPDKQDIMLYQELEDGKLISEKNYKKDFTVSKEQMLNKLADNFYSNAISYNNERRDQLDKEDHELINNKISSLTESIRESINTKNSFYREIKISKNYGQNHRPIYDVSFPFEAKIPIPNPKWELTIDGRTNEVIDIELSIPID